MASSTPTPSPTTTDTSGMTPYNGSGSFVTVNGQNFSAATPISVQSLMTPATPPPVPAPVNNSAVTSANVNAAVGAVHNNYQAPTTSTDPTAGMGAPITGTPTVPYVTINGKNYAANAADRQPGAGGASVPPANQTSVTSTKADLSTDAGIKQRFLELLGIQSTKGAETTKANTAAGVDTKTQALTDLQNEAITLKASYDNQIKNIRDNNPSGQLTGAQQQQIDQITKARDQALANNATLTLVAQGNLAAATKIATNQIAAEFQPVQDELDTLKAYNSVFLNDMSDSEKTAANQAFTKQQDEVNALRTAKSDAVTKLINAGQYTKETADKINAATTTDAVNSALVGVSGSGNLSATQVNDGAVRGGYDVSTFKTLPPDVQIFYSQTSDANMKPFKDNLTSVASGDMTLDDFNTFIDSQSISANVKQYFKSAAAAAAGKAPAKGSGFFGGIWDAVTGKGGGFNWLTGTNSGTSTTTPAK